MGTSATYHFCYHSHFSGDDRYKPTIGEIGCEETSATLDDCKPPGERVTTNTEVGGEKILQSQGHSMHSRGGHLCYLSDHGFSMLETGQ